MTLPQPDINHIRAEDLGSDERLKELYIGAVRHGYWRNSAPAVLEFAALAEKSRSRRPTRNAGQTVSTASSSARTARW